MGRTFVQPGNVLTLIAPAGGVVKGVGYLIGNLFVVALTTAAVDVEFEGEVTGVHRLTKVGSQAWAEGEQIYWDAANTRCSSVPTVGMPIGVAAEVVASGAGDVLGNVLLQAFTNGGADPRLVYQVRRRFTAAEVDAAVATLIPAVTGRKIRLISCKGIAIGGAAAGLTTADIVGTQAAGAVKLVAYAQASLTQSTVLDAGAAGAAVLADGASFIANDVSTPVTIGNTGNAMTTATHLDVIAEYALDT